MIKKQQGIKNYIAAVHDAANATSDFLTSQIHVEAHNSGWDKLATAAQVTYSKGRFEINVPEEHEKGIADLEYGTETTRPSAVLRRVGNRTQDAEKFLLGHVSQSLKGVL
jgi:hypothetical protein